MIKRKQVSVTVARTLQLKAFHPVTITVAEQAEVPENMPAEDAKLELYKSATLSVDKFLKNEVRKHGEE